jgi:hypothetical protein
LDISAKKRRLSRQGLWKAIGGISALCGASRQTHKKLLNGHKATQRTEKIKKNWFSILKKTALLGVCVGNLTDFAKDWVRRFLQAFFK